MNSLLEYENDVFPQPEHHVMYYIMYTPHLALLRVTMATCGNDCTALDLADMYAIKTSFARANNGCVKLLDDAIEVLRQLGLDSAFYQEVLSTSSTTATFSLLDLKTTLRVFEAASVLQCAYALVLVDTSSVTRLACTTIKFGDNGAQMRLTGYTLWCDEAAILKRMETQLKQNMRECEDKAAVSMLKTSLKGMKIGKGKTFFPLLEKKIVTLCGKLAWQLIINTNANMCSAGQCIKSFVDGALPHIDESGNVVMEPTLSRVDVYRLNKGHFTTTGCVSLMMSYYTAMAIAIQHMMESGKASRVCHVINNMKKTNICLDKRFHTGELLFVFNDECNNKRGKRKRVTQCTHLMLRSGNPVIGVAEWAVSLTDMCPYHQI